MVGEQIEWPRITLCKDCAHYRERLGGMVPSLTPCACAAPQRPTEQDPVYGHRPLCDARRMRQEHELSGHHCGPEAQWFEPKPAPPPASLWQRIIRHFNGN